MTRRRFAASVIFVGTFVAVLAARTDGRRADDQAPDSTARLAGTIAPIIDALWNGYDRDAAMGHVQFIAKTWRLPGNPSYNASIDRIKTRLEAAGLTPTVEEYPNSGPAWHHTVGTLALVTPGKPDELVISRERDEKDHIALCINSFSTAPEGVVAPLIDVGAGAPQDFVGKDVKGAVVLGNAAPGQLWSRAVTMGGAIGIVSASPPASYISPDAPGAAVTPREQWDIFQWTGVPYDAARKAFGFKASARAAAALRQRLAAAGSSPVSVHVTIASTFDTGPVRTLSVEITGRTAPAERIVMAAHVQEPGANDNASGVATLAETVVSLAAAIKQKKVAPPERTLTFLFLNEIGGSRRWLQDHAEAAKQVRYMFSLDMTGEDVKKTGGTFLIERYPDPGAVWTRPWDPHTEWGAGNVRAESLKGDLINDEHMFVVQQVAKRTGWVAKSNPYEGGSDHTVFQGAGVPSVLNWHFTDRYYHSNFDTPDKTSPDEMRNVGVSVGASAWLLASATPAIATDVAEVVAKAGRDRIAVETTEGGKRAAASTDAAVAARETTIVAAWKKWYAEAVRSASRLVVGTPPASFSDGLNRIASEFEGAATGGGPGKFAFVAAPALSAIGAPGQFMGFQERGSAAFVCGEDHTLPQPIPLTWAAVVLAGDGRLYVPCPAGKIHGADHREVREGDLIARGLASADPTIRWRAAQATARITAGPNPIGELKATSVISPVCNAQVQIAGGLQAPRRWQPGQLFRLLVDANVDVRKEAAYGLGVRLAEVTVDPELVAAAGAELRACLLRESEPEVQGLILEALGVSRYTSDQLRTDAELFIVQQSVGSPLKVLGAARGLEALFRQNARRRPDSATLVRLRQLVLSGNRAIEPSIEDVDARIRRLALMALLSAGDWDDATMTGAAMDRDWQVRRILAGRLNMSDESQASVAARLENDSVFQVRYDMVSAQSRLAARTGLCAPLTARLKDPSPAVAMRAMDVLAATCTDLDAAILVLTELADRLPRADGVEQWHLPSRALTNLARLRPEAAGPRLAGAAAHPAWQVRAAAAAATATVKNAVQARTLADDREPNVRTAALDALFRMKDPQVVPKAMAALRTSDDHQLLRMAATVLKGLPAADKDRATVWLLTALDRLTTTRWDTTRDPRVAILDRLAETMPGDRTPALLPYTVDADEAVAAAATKTYQAILNVPPSSDLPLRRRYPYQPPESAIASLPTQATITLKEGVVTLRLLPDVAPVTIARFAELARQRYYNDKTFHRIVTNFVVQGGSPGANEYMGTSRYMRDEVGPQASHLRGAVGISTRGGDTGDAQIFIDLVDVPRLDRDYTVFAYVTEGMEYIDRLLEGAKIVSISVR